MRIILAGDQGQNFLGEGDDDAACQSEEAVGTLRGIVGLQGQTNLDNAPAQQDQTDGADEAEDEGGQVVDYLQGVSGCGEGRHGHAHDYRHSQDAGGVHAEAALYLVGGLQLIGGLVLVLLEDLHGLFLRLMK